MIQVTKYITADGVEYFHREVAKEHEDRMMYWLKEIKEKCVFMDSDCVPAEIIGVNADYLYREIDRVFKAAVYVRIKDDISTFALQCLGRMQKTDLIANGLTRKRGLYKLNSFGLWKECHD